MSSETSAPQRSPGAAAAPADDRLDPAFLRMAGVLLLALLMALLDETIVNVGVDHLGAVFGAPLATIQWVTAGYLLAVAVATPVSGWGVDRFGVRRVWVLAVVLFTLGSLLSGLAWSAGSLIAFRVLQGLGGGMIFPVVQAAIARAAGPARVTKAMGLVSIPLTIGPVLGPVLGGFFVDDISWRWMFFINLPVGVIALVLAFKVLPAADSDPEGPRPRLDIVGLILLSPGFAVLIYGLTTAAHRGDFGDPVALTAFAVGAALLVGYVLHALRTTAPLIDVRLFGRRGFTMSVVTMLLVGAVANGLLFLTPLYYQQARGFGALHAGLLMIPSGILGAAGAISVGKAGARLTARATAPIGMLLAAVAALALSTVGAHTSQVFTALTFGVAGFGIGFTVPGMMAFMYLAVGPADAPRATSALFILNQIGGSLGIAVVAVVLQQRLAAAAGFPPEAYGRTYWIVAGFALVAGLAAALVPGPARPPAPQTE
ncbi:DHA2 family efflux MFS transporter permease subunit [Actinoplanes utahensis]|uniref:Multimultidrug transporter n=1 Tax=Actinoplanes utahensis TaxID=1869 RepID=A0A0A6US93_ACTUT|nr:DHA2 family efflux MFS transporter permease subunit [Actinoplanes utahensis]KHD78281.1 multimultidrug transporter [Actinoplanes utahensis]GIF28881.1 MFS transporter [Actinoplanes utahensis]